MIERSDLPLVTIVTPSYNQGRFIGATIESVLTQDYPNIEYIIMDGNSTDDTADVVKPYLDRLTFISEPDRGQSHAINKGFALARGSIVAWLNSDDLFLPGAISHAVEAFRTRPDAAAVYGKGYQIDETGAIKSEFPHTQHFDRWKLTYFSDYILQQAAFFRKSALDTVGPLREDLHFTMDWEIFIRLAKRYELTFIPEFMGAIREYETTKTHAGGGARIREIRRMLEQHIGLKIAPATIMYAIDPVQRSIDARLSRWPRFAKPLVWFLHKLTARTSYEILRRVSPYGQAWYPDGWMAPRAQVMLSEGRGVAMVRGTVPGNVPGLVNQHLTISYGGKRLVSQTLPPGDFEISFMVIGGTEQCPVLTIEASERFVFGNTGNSPDWRSLSLLLREVTWAKPLHYIPVYPLDESIGEAS